MADFFVLVLGRWLNFVALTILFGSSLFEGYSFVPAILTARRLRIVVVVAFVSALLWISGSIVSMTEDITSLYDPTTLSAFFFETPFGKAWIAIFLLLAMMTVSVFTGSSPRKGTFRWALISASSGAILVIEAWLGHAASGSAIGTWPPIAAYAMHVLAAGTWLGALPALAEVVRAPAQPADVEATLWRFSTIGIVCVTVILLSGIANTLFRIASPADIINLPYGRMIALKIVLLVILIGLAAQNRFQALPRIEKQMTRNSAIDIVKRNIFLEQSFGVAILLAAAVLGMLSPAG